MKKDFPNAFTSGDGKPAFALKLEQQPSNSLLPSTDDVSSLLPAYDVPSDFIEPSGGGSSCGGSGTGGGSCGIGGGGCGTGGGMNCGGGGGCNNMMGGGAAMPAPAMKPENKLFLGGLAWETVEDAIRTYFSTFGTVADCMVRLRVIEARSWCSAVAEAAAAVAAAAAEAAALRLPLQRPTRACTRCLAGIARARDQQVARLRLRHNGRGRRDGACAQSWRPYD